MNVPAKEEELIVIGPMELSKSRFTERKKCSICSGEVETIWKLRDRYFCDCVCISIYLRSLPGGDIDKK